MCIRDRLMDASDACARSASCFKVIGDLKSAAFFEERAELLAKVSKKEAPVPELRDPPDVPSFLLRDLVALLPSERIAFIQGPQQQEQTQQPQQQQQQQQQGTPLQQTDVYKRQILYMFQHIMTTPDRRL